MLPQLRQIAGRIGNTPIYELSDRQLNLFVKLEYFNYTGSIKDRPAFNIMQEAIAAGKINRNSIVVESSSGNFAISLATICAKLNIKFIAVIDPNISKTYEQLLNIICFKVIKVTRPDVTGGYLLTRLEMVRSLVNSNPDIYWTNQYENPGNYLSYYNGLGNEINDYFSQLDYLFVGVSTGGTITGLSLKLKEKFPNSKIIAVDVKGSIVFGGQPSKRYVSGIGASITSPVLDKACIDEVIYVSQPEILDGCERLLKDHMVFGGASTGAVYSAIKKYFEGMHLAAKPNVAFLCTDKGSGYLDSIYSEQWKNWLLNKLQNNVVSEDYALST